MAQIGDPEDEEKEFASLLKNQSLESITLEEALDLFKLPSEIRRIRRQGRHRGHWSIWTLCATRWLLVSIKADDGDDPHTITLERAIELIMAKTRRRCEGIASKSSMKTRPFAFLEGRYGPYIKAGKKNVKIPKRKILYPSTGQVLKN
jgi:DNA topoisomerase-1